ncbi:DMT family transporter [Butyricicoccus porcorum]|uniref:DMT family transporter n=1 Tax=Butyricicoccus porcorum TaxID=1945634 RepID=UPI0023544D49|nr:DMT family transporter [Butyricicoccus porcorum]
MKPAQVAFCRAACVCWGFENNCTRRMSQKDAGQIVVIKGLCSGCGSLLLALAVGETFPEPGFIALTMLLGFVAYGLSIFFYVRAQRELGAAKTSAYYAIAPFIGTGLSLLLFRQRPSVSFLVALAIMAAGTYFASTEGRPSRKACPLRWD